MKITHGGIEWKGMDDRWRRRSGDGVEGGGWRSGGGFGRMPELQDENHKFPSSPDCKLPSSSNRKHTLSSDRKNHSSSNRKRTSSSKRRTERSKDPI